MSVRSRRPWLGFRPTACGNTRETSFRPASAKDGEGRRFVTPRQTCPRPEGLGRNLRSKTRWFTGFCNSHQVSHFATFFIDARAEISVAESRCCCTGEGKVPRAEPAWGDRPGPRLSCSSSLAHPAPGYVVRSGARGQQRARVLPAALRACARPAGIVFTCSRVVLLLQESTMILPQVHLRKPCYDFSFL